jgi:hypothetical protein
MRFWVRLKLRFKLRRQLQWWMLYMRQWMLHLWGGLRRRLLNNNSLQHLQHLRFIRLGQAQAAVYQSCC